MDLFACEDINGVLDTGTNVILAEIRVVITGDLREWNPLSNQFQDALNGNPRPHHARFSKMNLRIDGDSVCHAISCGPGQRSFDDM